MFASNSLQSSNTVFVGVSATLICFLSSWLVFCSGFGSMVIQTNGKELILILKHLLLY